MRCAGLMLVSIAIVATLSAQSDTALRRQNAYPAGRWSKQATPSTERPKLSPLRSLRQVDRHLAGSAIYSPSFVASQQDASAIFLQGTTYILGGAVALVMADVNGDGKLDLLVASTCESSGNCATGGVSVLLGNGNGSFQPAQTYSSGGWSASSIAVADVNADGKPDLLVANECATGPGAFGCVTSGTVGVLLGNGDGTFRTAVNYGSGGYQATSIAVVDVNGDGKPDLLAANRGSSNVGVLLGNGDGTFQTALTYGSGWETSSVAVGDVNGDGKPDVVVAGGQTGTVSILLGNGDGTFKAAVAYGSGGQGDFSVAVGDVNGDGKLDVLVANEFACSICRNGNVGVLLGNGDGTFQPAQTYSSDSWATGSVALADVNGDGKPDLLLANLSPAGGANYGTVSVLLGNGDGTFQTAKVYASGGPALSVAVGDANGDGKPDLAVANDNVGVLSGNGDGTFQAGRNYTLGVIAGGAQAVAVVDVNGDGLPDLLGADCNDSECTSYAGVLLNNGDGTFQPAKTQSAGGTYPDAIAAADVNGDNKPDLLVVNECAGGSPGCVNGSVWVLLSNGDGTFQPAVTYGSAGTYANSVAIADVNGDGRPDLLVANYYDGSGSVSNGKVSVLLGNGDATFQSAQGYNSGGVGALSIAVADVNGDSKLDLLVANDCDSISDCTNGTVGVLLGNGDGTFQPAGAYNSGGGRAYAVAVKDMNGDGKLDLIVANDFEAGTYLNGSVAVLLGNGDGTFRAALAISVPLANDFGEIVVDDFNGDGKPDVATAAGYLFLGNADGTLQTPLSLSSNGLGIAAGDFNGDGKPDLALGSIAVLLNISAGFRYSTTIALKSTPNPANTGQPVIFAATMTPAFNIGGLTGDVTFYDGANTLSTVPISNGQATLTTSALTSGTHSITASYSGDSNYLSSVSSPLLQTVVIDTAPPAVTVSADPTRLWPPNGKMAPVTISGAITDSGSGVNASTATYEVVDEYGQVQPSGKITLGSGGSYSTTVLLQASRAGNDKDGRQYTVIVSAKDNAGNVGSASILVTVPHNQTRDASQAIENKKWRKRVRVELTRASEANSRRF